MILVAICLNAPVFVPLHHLSNSDYVGGPFLLKYNGLCQAVRCVTNITFIFGEIASNSKARNCMLLHILCDTLINETGISMNAVNASVVTDDMLFTNHRGPFARA